MSKVCRPQSLNVEMSLSRNTKHGLANTEVGVHTSRVDIVTILETDAHILVVETRYNGDLKN